MRQRIFTPRNNSDPTQKKSLLACPECDLLQQLPELAAGVVAECPRCGAILCRTQKNSLERTIAWVMAGLVSYIIAVTFPFLAMEANGISNETTLWSGIIALYKQDMAGLALVVFLTCIITPLFAILSQLYVLLPLRLGYHLPGAARLFSWTQRLRPWAMMEIYMLAILVSLVKLTKMARIIPGPALFSVIALVFVLAASSVSLDAHLVWDFLHPPLAGDRVEKRP
ncbi:MAG: hypothetical protein A2511_06890 [Deltaproteobacteria bacterium RIFOXYD12_FULL_50_9]|nr:MAG: hypothetical protein A2511_06890 [Deltaproteobacteria bacterium RIFOXYD12_FULL_50_9]